MTVGVFAQSEILINAQIIEMTKIGLDKEIITKKIKESPNCFDVSANALIELKKNGVDNEVISLMLANTNAVKQVNTKDNEVAPVTQNNDNPQNYSDSQPIEVARTNSQILPTAKEALLNARTLAIEKSSINPSRQAIEKELLKRKEWRQLNLNIVRYKESADLYIEIGFVHFSLITHRYVWRIYDRRSGIIIVAGETTSWGSLAENLARDIGKKINLLAAK